MKTRAITGFFFTIVMLGSFLLGYQIFAAFYLVLSCFCLYEFYSLIKKDTATPNVPVGILSGALFSGAALLNYSDMFALPALNGHQLAYLLLFLFVLSVSCFYTGAIQDLGSAVCQYCLYVGRDGFCNYTLQLFSRAGLY
jgi:phosphatidate cytidylyltransferase